MSDDKSFVKGLAALHKMACCPPEPEPDERDAEIARLTEELADRDMVIKALGTAEFSGGKWRFRKPEDQEQYNSLRALGGEP